MNKYHVTEECVSCHACIEVAGNNFEMSSSGLAYVKKQPENKNEEKQCEQALDVCPVAAIERLDQNDLSTDQKPILASFNVKETLDKYPQLKDILIEFSPKFKKLLNPVMYNTLAHFASFNEAARVTGLSVCEILHVINQATGTIDALQNLAPDCVKITEQTDLLEFSEPVTWEEPADRYLYNMDSMGEIIDKISKLEPQQCLVAISVAEPVELVKTAKGLGLKVHVEKGRDYRVSVFNPALVQDVDWKEEKHKFEQLDVRFMQTDPFDIIIKKAYATAEGNGFVLIQRFEPVPIINMLTEMGFEHISEPRSDEEIWVYFYKTPIAGDAETGKSDKTDVVIQSATPVAYPVIMRLLQSETIRKKINIKELKVWEETEKHLAWITNGKADISFSALITSVKLRNSDVKIPALFVWDNFVMLTRYPAKGFKDVKGRNIHTPLFEEAPPSKITKYLIRADGLDPDDFNFVYGKPFGRPEEIYYDFVTGKADTVILREPEASYAIKIMRDRSEEISVISYNDLWNKVNPGFGSFPNAGIVFKGEFVRNNPELAGIFLQELQKAIDWVNRHRKEAAQLSFDMMRQPVDRIELFLNRVNFNYVSGDELVNKVKDYFNVLIAQGVVDSDVDNSFYDIFTINHE